MREFKSTYLYIKRHPITGLLYLGKTYGTEKYLLENYLGSGDYWEDYLKIHGKNGIETLWYCLFTEKDELVKFALMLSEQMNIVKAKNENGKKIWTNLMPENGLDGGHGNGGKNKGKKYGPQSKEHKENNSASQKKKPSPHKGIPNLKLKGRIPWNKGIKQGPHSTEVIAAKVARQTGKKRGPNKKENKCQTY